ncbi:unnamed protein product, partial [Ixodes persulcatus]
SVANLLSPSPFQPPTRASSLQAQRRHGGALEPELNRTPAATGPGISSAPCEWGDGGSPSLRP